MIFKGLKGTVNLDPTETTGVSRAPLNGFQIVKWETGNTLPGADDSSAKIALYSGHATVSNNRTIGSLATSVGTYGDLMINPGVTLTLANGDLDMGDINHWVKGGGSLTSGTPTLAINRDISEGFNYEGGASDVSISGATIVDNSSGAVSLLKTGGGKLRIRTANSYTGDTVISQGHIELDHVNGLGSSANPVLLNDAGTSFFNTGLYLRNGLTYSRAIRVVGAGAPSARPILGSLEAGTMEFAGDIEMNKFSYLEAAAGSTVTFSGDISGANGRINKIGPGTVILTGSNTHAHGTEILEGVLISDSTARLGVSHLAIKNGSIFRYTGSGSETTTQDLWLDVGASTIDITQASATLAWNPNAGKRSAPFTKEGPGTLAVGGAFTGNASITVTAGTMILSADNSYTGDTTVSGGTLLIHGTHTNGGLIHVLAGATLGGNGTVGDVEVEDNGILAPGNSAGHLTVGELALHPNSNLYFELGAPTGTQSPGSDFVTIQQVLTLQGRLHVTALPGFGSPVVGDHWLIMSSNGGVVDNGLSVVSAPALAGGLSYEVNTYGGPDVFLVVVPEAATGLLAALGLLLLRRAWR